MDKLQELTVGILFAVGDAIEGNTPALDIYIRIKELEKALKSAAPELKAAALVEAEKYKGQDHMGYTISVKSAPGKYNYSHIPEIEKLAAQIKDLQKLSQEAYKQAGKGRDVLEGGVIIQAAVYNPAGSNIELKAVKH